MKVYTAMGQVKFLVLFNRLPHELLGCASAIILMTFFCEVNIFPQLEELPQKVFRILLVSKIICYENGNVIDMDH
jgi:hypothetical protein